MADLIELSSRIIDSGHADQPVNRITQELSEIADTIAMVESFSHAVVLDSGDGLVVFDTSGHATGQRVVAAIRSWRSDPIHTAIYTHGHLDHVGGSGAFVADALVQGHARPRFVGHEAVVRRLDRYRATDGFNSLINQRQFGWQNNPDLGIGREPRGRVRATSTHFVPDDVVAPDTTYLDSTTLTIGAATIDLHHDRGETDDHTWAWLPAHRAICSGDFLIWNYPNAGNPQKVQRYAGEWAAALRSMAALEPELILPAHGLPIAGQTRIARVLDEVATTLEDLEAAVMAMMNEGASLDEIIHTVHVPPDTLARPYLRPLYDEPEFVVRNIWRLYGGWWDGDYAHLKPPPAAHLARELAALAGGVPVLVTRAQQCAADGDLRLAAQLIEFAVQADPASQTAHAARAEIYTARRKAEPSLMAKGIFSAAARESQAHLEPRA